MTAAVATAGPCRARELDDVTLSRAQTGDPAAFRALVETYQDAVFALLWRFLGRGASRALVEDLAQTTFLGVWRSLARFSPSGPARLSTWILTIAVRAALKERRAPQLLALDELADGGAPPEHADHLVGMGFADALARALAALPAPYRAVFVLRAYHDFDYQDIAASLDLDLGTVKSRLSRARSQLRTLLQEFAP